MEKVIKVDGKEIKLKSTGAFLLRYKRQFQRDAIKDIYKLSDGFNQETKKLENIEVLDLEVFYNLVWTLAKTADETIAPPLEWLDSFESFPLIEILPEAIDMLLSSLSTTKTFKKK